ncbi:hypothetical protein LCAUCD174_2125 [Lacticaseibacillus paracasei]|uniref:DUF1642 domain-containing protein n=1 Tax=Lacticaseibacillus paracasei TaxID=1597 RepID=UPI000297BD0E|nr:DUF1642 domain-containing protein [Lacticaseibacillus paracasei]EKQ17877.1 hypothetical protein LCAUCD174_2125 [Lacticaseibacillus paracasei]
MSEEKLYVVKNDEGKYLDNTPCWDDKAGIAIKSNDLALAWVEKYGGHVVMFVEDPEKEAVSESVGGAIDSFINADTYVQAAAALNYLFASRKKKDFKRIMKAVRNGYTVAKEKKYNVKVPYAEGWHFQKYSSASKLGARNNWRPFPAKDIDSNMSKELFQFTLTEIEHYGLQDCEKEEVTDDEQ